MLTMQTVKQDTIFENNLAALEKRDPELYQKVISASDHFSSHIFCLKEGDIFPNILINRQGEKFFYYDACDPMGYCKDYIDSLNLKYAPVAVFFGFGLGYQVAAVLQEFSERLNTKYIIIVEKDVELFRAALKVLDLSQLIMHNNIRFFVGVQSKDFFAVFRSYIGNPQMARFFRNFKVITMPANNIMDDKYYQEAFESLRLSVRHTLEDLGNEPYDSLLGVEHTLTNLVPMIENPWIISFKNAFKSKPAIIVGAGPSLKKNIHLLKEAYHKMLIVATDAALKPLMKEGIKPHLVTTIERTMVTVDFYSDLEGLEEIFFVFCPLIYNETYQSFKGRKIVAHRYTEYLKWLNLPKGALSGGPLVGNFAFNIAQYLGCDPILMVGQDLSFKSEGLTHIFGNLQSYRKNMVEVEGNYGDVLMTNRYFEASRRSLEMQIEEFGGLCINATEGGAIIKNTLFLSLKDAMRNYCGDSFDYFSQLEEIWNQAKSSKIDPTREIKRILSILNATVAQLDDFVKKCKKGLDLIHSIENNHLLLNEKIPNPSCLNAIDDTHDLLEEIRGQIISNPYFIALSNIFSPYHTYFEMEKNTLYDRFHHKEFQKLKSFLMMKDWFAIMGQLFLSTQYSIENAISKL